MKRTIDLTRAQCSYIIQFEDKEEGEWNANPTVDDETVKDLYDNIMEYEVKNMKEGKGVFSDESYLYHEKDTIFCVKPEEGIQEGRDSRVAIRILAQYEGEDYYVPYSSEDLTAVDAERDCFQ